MNIRFLRSRLLWVLVSAALVAPLAVYLAFGLGEPSAGSLDEGGAETMASSTAVTSSTQSIPHSATPGAPGESETRAVSAFSIFSLPATQGAAFEPVDAATVEEVLEQGLGLAGASPVHIGFRGTAAVDSVRCEWRGIARTPEQREAAIRFWLGLTDDDPLPSPAEAESRLISELDRIGVVYPATVISNFRAIARGGLTNDYEFLTCYADYTVQEYVLGAGPTGASNKLTVAYDRMSEAWSYELYKLAHEAGEMGDEALLTEEEYGRWRGLLVSGAELVLRAMLEGSESVVFLAPMGEHNAIAVEAWQAVAQWDVQTAEDGTVNAVRFGVSSGDPEQTQTLANLKSRITTATTPTPVGGASGTSSEGTTTPATTRIANVNGLTQYYRDAGAYGDITPDDGSTTTFTPSQEPLVYVPKPTSLTATALGEDGASLTWSAVTGAAGYQVQHRVTGATDDETGPWTTASNSVTGTSHSVSGLWCGKTHEFRVGAYGNGTTYNAKAGLWSDTASATMGACTAQKPRFRASSYSFEVTALALDGTSVGTVSAYDVNDDTGTYSISAGNSANKLAIDTNTGEITVAGSLSSLTGTTYTLTVSAADGVSGTTSVTVTVSVTAPTCSSGTAVPEPHSNYWLVRDCEALLSMKDTLRGTATLDWAASAAVTGWEGITTAGTPGRVTRVELANETLSGTIPSQLGTLFELTHLDLSQNSLTGDIPVELGWLNNLESLKLSGNTLSGCIPIALEGVAINDLGSLNLLYCQPPAPQNLSAGTPDETSLSLSWAAVLNTSKYHVEYRLATADSWTTDDDTLTGTNRTVEGLTCENEYRFRVSAYGSGTVYEAAWSLPSEVLSVETRKCNTLPEFVGAPYAFTVAEDTAEETVVGTVAATDPDEDNTITYTITAGNTGDVFDIDGSTGALTVAGDLDYETTPSYSLTMQAEDGRGGSATTTAEIEITNVIELPARPQNLNATVEGSSVSLEWDAPDDATVAGYQILRRQPSIHAAGVFLTIVEDTGSIDTFYLDASTEPQTQYVYRVAAVNSDGTGGRSGFVSVLTGLPAAPAPQGLEVSLTEGTFSLSWTAVSGTTRYEVQYRTTGDRGEWATAATTTTVTATYGPEGGLACGTNYEFRVRAQGDGTTHWADWGEVSGTEEVTTARCNDPPAFTASSYAFLVLEGSAADTLVGTVTATDPDNDTVTHSIASGNEDDTFEIAAGTGEITLASSLGTSAVGTVYSLSVEANDGYGGTSRVPVTVTVAAAGCSGGIAVPDPTANAGLVSDCETLLGLKNALAGTGTLNWNGGTAVTSWDGVTVGGGPKRVTRLKLRNSGLTGTIPPELADLANLHWLEFHLNGLTGDIPEELGNLTDLVYLILADNALTGEIPPELGSLPNLAHLWLQGNQLSGEIPQELGGLTVMSIFRLHNNQFTGAIPPELGNLSGASIVHLSGNPLQGCLPPGLRDVSNNDFSSLGLPYCTHAGVVSTPTGLTTTLTGQTVTIRWSAVTGAGQYEVQYRMQGAGGEWSGLPTIVATSTTYSAECETTYEFRVRAYGNGTAYAAVPGNASGAEPVTTGSCNRPPAFVGDPYAFTVAEDAVEETVVGTVTATDPDVGDTVTYTLTSGNTGDVFDIDGSTGAITVAGDMDYETTPSYSLIVEASDGEGGTDTASVTITVIEDSCTNGIAVPSPDDSPELVSDCKVLLGARDTLAGEGSLDWTAFTAIEDWDGVKIGGSPRRVTALHLWTRELSGTLPPELAQLGKLSDLHLGNNRLTGGIPHELGGLAGLRRLALYSNRLTGEIPTKLGELTNLRALLLSGNLLDGSVPTQLGGLSGLESLSLHSNQLTGGIPTQLGGLTALRTLYLQGNRLTGPVPPEIGQLSDLQTMWLQRNRLSGKIPPELGGLTNLTDLALYENQLSGEIPSELGGLTNLTTLSLSSNLLTGAIRWELGGLTNLLNLHLDRNALVGCVPPTLRSVDNNDLSDLGLSDCTEEGPAPAPEELSVSVTVDEFTVTWNAVTGVSRYEVEYRVGAAGEWESVGTATTAVLTYSPEGGPVCGTSYGFRVRSYGDAVTYAAGWGHASEVESASGLCVPTD